MANKEAIQPKIYRIDLNTFTATEAVLSSLPCQIALSGNGKILAVASLSEVEKLSSVLTVFEADSLKTTSTFEIIKNPGMLCFSNNNNTLTVGSYGYQIDEVTNNGSNTTTNENNVFKIPTQHFVKCKRSIPAGIEIINLTTMKNRQFELGMINEDFIAGNDANIIK
jgi:hypothetical protein